MIAVGLPWPAGRQPPSHGCTSRCLSQPTPPSGFCPFLYPFPQEPPAQLLGSAGPSQNPLERFQTLWNHAECSWTYLNFLEPSGMFQSRLGPSGSIRNLLHPFGTFRNSLREAGAASSPLTVALPHAHMVRQDTDRHLSFSVPCCIQKGCVLVKGKVQAETGRVGEQNLAPQSCLETGRSEGHWSTRWPSLEASCGNAAKEALL